MNGTDRAAPYLVVLYAAEGRWSSPIPPGYVADALDRSPAATTEMFQRLERRDLVTREEYEGVTLTDAGWERGAELYEQYVTLCRFFRDVLEMESSEREALALTGTVSATVTDRLATTLLSESHAETNPADAGFLPLPANSP